MSRFVIKYSELKKLGIISSMNYYSKEILYSGDNLNSDVYRLVFDVFFKEVNESFSVLSCISGNNYLSSIAVMFDETEVEEICALSNGEMCHIDIDTTMYNINRDNIYLQYGIYNAIKESNDGYFVNRRNMLLYSGNKTYIITFNNKHWFRVKDVTKNIFNCIDKISKFDNWLTDKAISEAITGNKFSNIVSTDKKGLCFDGKNISLDELIVKFKESLICGKLYPLYIEFIGD